MANYCDYKVIVKGKKNACYAFFGSMSCVEEKWIVEEGGTDEAYTIQFEGNCKWAVDAYCTPWDGEFPVILPEDADEAMAVAEEKYWYNTVKERSKMFEVEVWCNSADVEDYDPNMGPFEIFEHYINGESVGGECPDELHIDGRDQDDEDVWVNDLSETGDIFEELVEELEFVKEVFGRYSDEEIQKILTVDEAYTDGKLDRDKTAKLYIEMLFEEDDIFPDIYDCDFEQFKAFTEKHIEGLF